jgi:hypothetical protein
MNNKLNPRRATSLPPHDRQLVALTTLTFESIGKLIFPKKAPSLLIWIIGRTELSYTQGDTHEEEVTPPSTEQDEALADITTPVKNSPDPYVTSSTTKAKGRKRADDANDLTPEEFQKRLDKMKNEVIANGGKVFTCEHFGGSAVCHTLQVNTVDQRLCVSDFFGRNKSKTRGIKRPITWCRKHYQRFSYQAKSWQATKLFLISQQLERIEEDDPGTTYNISLKKSEEKRLSEANNNRAGNNTTTIIKKAKKDEAPIPTLQHIYDSFLGKNKTKEDCEELVTWCGEELKKGTFENIPRVEMVPQFKDQVEEVDEEDADDEGEASEDEDEDMTDATPTPKAMTKKASRISKKGAIQKP